MRTPWSIRRTVSLALLASFVAVPLLAALVYVRLYQMLSQVPRWAELAEASRYLSQGITCGGGSGADLAQDDLQRWRGALETLTARGAGELGDEALANHLEAMRVQVGETLAGTPEVFSPWAQSHCAEVKALSGRALEAALRMARVPSSRAHRVEDLAIRDVTMFLAVWAGLALILLLWVRRTVVRPAALIVNVLQRVADGDLDARVPQGQHGEMARLAEALEHAVRRFDRRDHLKVQRIIEMRNLVERVLAFVEAPVVIIGVDGKVDYANPMAAEAFGAAVEELVGAEVTKVPGGEALKQVVDQVLTTGVGHDDHPLDLRGSLKVPHVARCAMVRDGRGAPTRVIVMLEADRGPWWQRMWQGAT
ncbi:MAG: HAMP domain-containing protein [Deltaproteobacteria bacterium]|nr:HAMP domain-containing protein [Deltaproteobacteria bacterium]